MEELNDSFLITSYLQEVKKRSTGAFENNKSILRHFFKRIDKQIKDLTTIDVRDYFVKYIDKQNIQLNTKETKRFTLVGFFNYVEKMYLANDLTYSNPVPSKKIFQFTKKSTDIKRYSQIVLKILSKKQINEVLNYAKENMDLRSLTILLLEVFTGARISEVRTLLRDDIHLNERFFETGFTIDARKSTLNKTSGLIFFFPEIIIPYLKKYEKTLENSRWYFPGYSDVPLSTASVRKIYVKIRRETGIFFSFHYFRRSLITERRKIGCPEGVSEALMCHASSSVEAESYVKLTVAEKRDVYDKWNPYENLDFFKK